MLIFGWGTDTAIKQLNEWTVAICRYRYFSIFFVFSVVVNKQWFLQGRDRAHDTQVTREQLESMHGADAVPKPTFWRSWSLLAVPGSFVALSAVVAIVSGVAGLFGFEGETVAAAEPVAEVAAADEPDGPAVDESAGSTDNGEVEEPGSDEADANEDTEADSLQSSAADANPGAEDAPASDTGIDDAGQASSTADAVASQIELVGDSKFMSSDMENPGDPDYVELTIDSVHATSSAITDTYFGPTRWQIGDVDPEDGNKLVVVDLQMLGGSDSGNVGHDAIRLVDEQTGALFAPAFPFNTVMRAGTLFNERLAFEVPAELVSFTIQGGVLDGQRDGYQTNYNVELEPRDITAYQPADGPIIEGPASVSLTSDNNVGSPNLEESNRGRWAATFDVLKAEVVAKIGPTAPNVGYKYLVLDAQVVGTETRGNVGHSSIRLLADGEWYQAPIQFNEVLNDGTIWSDRLVYEIPVAATSATVEFGTPNHWTGGQRAEYQLTLPTG